MMSMLAPKLNHHLKSVKTRNSSTQQPKVLYSEPSRHPFLLQAIIEGFVDGVLILTEKGEWIHANDCARRICHQFSSEQLKNPLVPLPIWQICEALIESRELFPNERMIIEAEIGANDTDVFRVRVRWLNLGDNDSPFLLVTLEDRKQSTHNVAIAEAKKYELTPREAEVWLLRRANYSYKEIAAKLYITINTVKKHMKNVYAKQQSSLWNDETQSITSFN